MSLNWNIVGKDVSEDALAEWHKEMGDHGVWNLSVRCMSVGLRELSADTRDLWLERLGAQFAAEGINDRTVNDLCWYEEAVDVTIRLVGGITTNASELDEDEHDARLALKAKDAGKMLRRQVAAREEVDA